MFSHRSVLLAVTSAAAVPLALSAPLTVHAQDHASAKVYDLKAEALLQHAADQMKAAHSFSAQIKYVSQRPASANAPTTESRSISTFRVQRPNLVCNEVGIAKQGTNGKWIVTPVAIYISNGKKGGVFSPSTKTYRILPVTQDALANNYGLSFQEFFAPTVSEAQIVRASKASDWLASLAMAPDAIVGGVPCSVVEEKSLPNKKDATVPVYQTKKVYIGKKDGLIHGYRTETPAQSGEGIVATEDTILTNVSLGGNIPTSVFSTELAGYTEYVAPKRPQLLTAGTLAPDFTAFDKDGKAIRLSNYKGKIVVLDFWATWCGPCLASLPHTTEVAKKTAGKGVVVLAVNVLDKQEEFTKWLPLHPEYAPLTFAIDIAKGKGQDVATKLYKVSGIPTQYVIDRSGKVVASFVGFAGPTDALEKAIVKADGGAAVAQR